LKREMREKEMREIVSKKETREMVREMREICTYIDICM